MDFWKGITGITLAPEHRKRLSELMDVRLIVHSPMAAPAAALQPVKSRAKRRQRLANKRERAILAIPLKVPMADYCRELDRLGVAFPDTWQEPRLPRAASHLQAWNYRHTDGTRPWFNRIKSERANVWKRFQKRLSKG